VAISLSYSFSFAIFLSFLLLFLIYSLFHRKNDIFLIKCINKNFVLYIYNYVDIFIRVREEVTIAIAQAF